MRKQSLHHAELELESKRCELRLLSAPGMAGLGRAVVSVYQQIGHLVARSVLALRDASMADECETLLCLLDSAEGKGSMVCGDSSIEKKQALEGIRILGVNPNPKPKPKP